MSDVVVTGASGFVGRRLVARLCERGTSVRAVVSGRRGFAPFDPRVKVHVWDALGASGAGETADPARGAGQDLSFVEGASAVCHLAAFLPPSMASSAAARACLEVNALATLALLEAASRGGARRFVHVSSGNAYRAQDRPVSEEDPLYPSAKAPYYLASKLCGEIFASHFGETGALDVCVLRPSAIYGPSMPQAGLVPTFATRLRAGQPIDVTDGGVYTVDLVHVDDVVSAILAALENKASGAFNVGSGEASTPRGVAETLAEILGADRSLIRSVPPVGPPARGFSPLDVTRARHELGYRPRDLRTGLADYVASLGDRS